MPGTSSRRKGYRLEVKVRAIARASGLESRRVPLSGSAPDWRGDLEIDGRTFELKARAHGFQRLYRWLGPHASLILAANRREPLAVVRLADLVRDLAQCRRLKEGESKTSRRPSGTTSRPC